MKTVNEIKKKESCPFKKTFPSILLLKYCFRNNVIDHTYFV